MQKTFIYYTDPGHGWAKIPIKLLENLGIANKISSHSYYRGGFAYLEEDCDMSLLIKRLRYLKVEPKFKPQHTDNHSKIRNYKYYNNSYYKIKE